MTDARTSLGGMSVELSISWRAGLHVGKLHAEALDDETRSLCGIVTLAAFGAKESSSVPRCKRCTRIAGAALRAARKAFERRTLRRPKAARPRNPVPVDGIASEGMA